MRSLRSKLILFLMIYFAGFGTALYFLAPVDSDAVFSNSESVNANPANLFISPEQITNLGQCVRDCVGIVSVKACGLGDFVKTKFTGEEGESDD